MKQSVCVRKMTLFQNIIQKIQFNNRFFVDNSDTIKDLVWQHTRLMWRQWDTLNIIFEDYNIFRKLISDKSNLWMDLYNKEMTRLFAKLGRWIQVIEWKASMAYKWSALIENPELLKEYIKNWTINWWRDLSTAWNIEEEWMAFFWKYLATDNVVDDKLLDELHDTMIKTFDIFLQEDYNVDNIFRYLNEWDILLWVLWEIWPAYKVEMASAIPLEYRKEITNFKEVREHIVANTRVDLALKWIQPTDNQLKTMISDLCWDDLYKDSKIKWLIRFADWLKWVYGSLKFFAAPFTAPLMMAQAFVIWSMNLLVRSIGMPMLASWKAVDFFIDEIHILKAEKPFDKSIQEEMGDNWYGTFVNKIIGNEKVRWVVRWWWQSIFDMVIDNTVKRRAIASALSKEWWNFKNEELLLKYVKEWRITKDTVDRIAANALMYYTDFKTNSSSLFLSRNTFSRRYAINALQWYTTNRVSEVFRSVYNFSQAIRQWKVNDWKTFFDYLDDPANQEFKWLFYAPLITSKFAFYTDKIMNDENEEWKIERIKNYAMWLNDFISSWDATFVGKVFWNVLEYEGAYIDYVNSKWETGTLYWWMEAGIYWFLWWIMSSLFREAKVLSVVANPAKMLMQWESDMSVLINQTELEIKKIAEWMWRFNLLPWLETFWLQKIPQSDDFFSTILMNLSETNESLKTSSRLKKMEEIEKILQDPINISKTLTYFNVVKYALWDEVSKAELKYDKLMAYSETDNVMKNLYKWVFDKNIFNQMDSDSIYNIYDEMTDLDLSKLGLDKKWMQEVLWNADTANMKVWTFMELLTKKIWIANLDEVLSQWWPNSENVGLQKIFALVENSIPWASRVLISYAANKLQDKLVTEMNARKGNNETTNEKKLLSEEKTEIQKTVISKLYPFMYIADKSSWYSLIIERTKQLEPNLFWKKDKNWSYYADKSVTSLVNSLWLMDSIAFSEWQKANPNAKYIANVYSLIGKYVTDTSSRLAIMNNTYETIERMNIDPKMKTTMKVWNALGNIDILDIAIKDKNFVAQNWWILWTAIKTVFGALDSANKIWMSTLLEDLEDKSWYISNKSKQANWNWDAKKQALSYWKTYPSSQYDNSNRESFEKLSNKVPWIISNLPKDYKSWQNIRFPYDINSKYQQPTPMEYRSYQKIYEQTKALFAKTENIVTGYVKRSPTDVTDKLKVTSKYSTPKWTTVKKYKIPKWKTLRRRYPLVYDQ